VPVYSEIALKARYCAQMMAAAAVLAGTAPDDFRRRVLARHVFVYCHEFIRWARRAKNELRGRPQLRETVRELDRALNELERRDWGSYEDIRHRIAAHRQTLAATPTDAILRGGEMWNDISEATVRILSETPARSGTASPPSTTSRRSTASRRSRRSSLPRSPSAATSPPPWARLGRRIVRRDPRRLVSGHAGR